MERESYCARCKFLFNIIDAPVHRGAEGELCYACWKTEEIVEGILALRDHIMLRKSQVELGKGAK